MNGKTSEMYPTSDDFLMDQYDESDKIKKVQNEIKVIKITSC